MEFLCHSISADVSSERVLIREHYNSTFSCPDITTYNLHSDDTFFLLHVIQCHCEEDHM